MDEDGWGRDACRGLGGDEVGIAREGGDRGEGDVLNEVFVIVVTRLEGEDDTPTAMRVGLYMRWNVHMCRQLALVSRGLRDGANGLGLLLLREIHLMGREKVVRARSRWCQRQVGGCDQVRSTVDATRSLS